MIPCVAEISATMGLFAVSAAPYAFAGLHAIIDAVLRR